MKIFRYLTALAAAAMTFTACEKDPADLYALNATAPVMDSHADILLTESSTQESVTFSWKEARNMGGEVMYTLYATNEGQEISLTTTSGTYFTTGKDAFRELLLTGFNLEANNNFSIGMYVEASNGAATLSSEAITMNVFVYGDYVPAIVSVVETAQEGVVLTEAMTENVELISWTAARFEYGTNPLYKVEVVYGEGRQTLAEGMPTTSFGMNPTTLNSTLIALGCVKEAANDVQFIVTSYLEGEGAPQLESTAVTVTVTPFTPSYPEFIKLCGDFGGHSWKPESNLPILKGDANTGVYHGLMSYYGGTYGMKIIYTHPKTEEIMWVGAKTEDGVNFAVGVEDNIAPEEGSYIVYVDLAKATMTLTKIESIGLIGDFNSWGEQKDFTYNAETGAFELEDFTHETGTFKVRVNNDWDLPAGYNLGGDPDDMVYQGANIAPEPGTYKVTMNLSTDENYKVSLTKTGDVVVDDPMTKNYGLCGTITDWAAGADLAFEKVEGEDYVIVKNVTVTAEDAFKVRVDNAWAENYGGPGETKPYVLAVDTKVELVAGGQDMAMAAGSYDFYFYPKTKEIIAVVAGGELPTPTAAYAVIGKFNEWNPATQVPMEEANNGYVVAKNLNLTGLDIPDNGFKVKENVANWDNSWGSGSVLELGVPTAVYHNGGNMGLAAEGAYDVYFNAEKLLIIVVAAGADDPTGAETPDTPTETADYAVIGKFNEWNPATQVPMEEANNGYVVAKNLNLTGVDLPGNGFKVKENVANWDNSWGSGSMLELGVPTAVYHNGGNMGLPAEGSYDIYFNPEKLLIIVVAAGADDPTGAETPDTPTETVYSVAGDFNSWGETDMADNGDGFFVLKNQTVAAGNAFKFKKNHSWLDPDCWGSDGAATTVGVAITLVQPGANIPVPAEGTYDIYFNPTTATAYVMNAGEVPGTPAPAAHTYSLAGTFNSWTETDTTYTLTEGEEGVYTYQNLALTAAGEFKIVRDYAWTVNYGLSSGASAVVGQKMAVTTNGANIAIAAGTYNITFYAASSELLIEAVGSSEPATPLEWGNDIFKNFYETESGSDKNTEITKDLDFGNGLKFIAGSGKCKFGADGGKYRIQYGGAGDFDKQTLALTVTGPGTLELTIRSSNSSEERYMGVWVDQVANYTDPGYKAPVSGEDQAVYTIDCSSAKNGSVINFHCLGKGINVYNIKWTPAQ